MFVIIVDVHVKAESLDAFIAATAENARNSLQEPECYRFDLQQQLDDPTRFVLVEVYERAESLDAHKTTAHYLTWRDTVADMMATPRASRKFRSVIPTDADFPR